MEMFTPRTDFAKANGHGKLSDRLELIEGSSTASDTLTKVRALLGGLA
jgi:hypothetical protein